MPCSKAFVVLRKSSNLIMPRLNSQVVFSDPFKTTRSLKKPGEGVLAGEEGKGEEGSRGEEREKERGCK